MNDIEQIPINFEKQITEADLSNISETNSDEVALGVIKSVLQLEPTGVGSAVVEAVDLMVKMQYNSLIRKTGRYLLGLREIKKEQIEEFRNDISITAQDGSGNVLLDTLQRLDNWNKAAILANLTMARVNRDISIEDFFRAASALERIPYVDLKYLERYVNDYYDPVSTPMIVSSGAIEETVIDPNDTSKYRLSSIGNILLRYGMGIKVDFTPLAKQTSMVWCQLMTE